MTTRVTGFLLGESRVLISQGGWLVAGGSIDPANKNGQNMIEGCVLRAYCNCMHKYVLPCTHQMR